MLVRFTLRLAVSEIQDRQSEKHRMTTNWTWIRNRQKYPVYTNEWPPSPKLWAVSLYA